MEQTSGQPPLVGVVMGSKSDWETMQEASKLLFKLSVPHECKVVSAHRTPDRMNDYAKKAAERGLKAIIAGAGGAAHLPGMLAAQTVVPVLGVPIQSRALSGMDSLLSIVQMPSWNSRCNVRNRRGRSEKRSALCGRTACGHAPGHRRGVSGLSSSADSGRARQRIGSLKTRVLAAPEGLEPAAKLLAAGELVALPTETVYGLGAAALDPLACARIFEAKERPLSDPLIVHLPDSQWLDRLARPNALAIRLANEFWPGPLTLVLPRQNLVPDLVTAGQTTVALRMSAHPVFAEVSRIYGKPIAAPSANRFGRISPTSASHVLTELGGRIPLIIDGGPCLHGIESTIVRVHEHGVEILRHGPVTEERLSEFAAVVAAPAGHADAGIDAEPLRPGNPR